MGGQRLLAVSMRVSEESLYPETRDAIARDWWPFLRRALPGWMPVLLPNDPEWAGSLCRLRGVGGLLLTGGNDVGSVLQRDRAEEAAFRSASDLGLPVLGICRGLQFLVSLHGGLILDADPAVHRRTRHPLDVGDSWIGPPREVNSFHTLKAQLPGSGDLVESARGPDGALEAFRHRTRPIAGIGWHPEREPVASPDDLALFAGFFGHRKLLPED